MKRSFGRFHAPDDRDRRFQLKRSRSLRTVRNWRCGPVLDQGDLPHCVGFAAYAWLDSAPIRQHPITPSGIYYLAQHFDEWEGTDYDGTSVRGAAKVLTTTGHIQSYHWGFDLDTVVDYVLEEGPMMLGINWYRGMGNPSKEGVIRATGRLDGGHAILMRGVDTKRGLARLRQSWGADWGVRGDCWLPLDDLDRLIREDGEACAAKEQAA